MKWILVLVILGLTGCSTISMNKDCKPVEGSSNKFMCRTVMPWESI